MIHLMELPNPDPLTGRPEHDQMARFVMCLHRDLEMCLTKRHLDKAGIPYTLSRSGRPAIFTRVQMPMHLNLHRSTDASCDEQPHT
ncbi:hypothetical protein Sango_1525700 [Sesamum angolense]|uniref:Uncharacterized protein n=1 Tax=Sesamum angolense TaxID=2727404 RepID=A0AAE2BT72_9LAMI|nr:hypothetical protein Sango_1525700 [Sesamum angolense]